MIIPPAFNTKEREDHDISCLRIIYLLCEDPNLANDEHVQAAFLLLRKLVGKSQFQSEFNILQDFIEKQKLRIEMKEKKEMLYYESQLYKADLDETKKL